MSNEDKDSLGFEAQREQEAKEARKKLKDAEKAKPGKEAKEQKPAKSRGKKAARWLRDFRGEIKKILWPDFKTVLKNTGIVLLVVLIIGSMVWVIDFGLTTGIKGFKHLATGISQQAKEEPTDDGTDDLLEEPDETPN